MKRVLSLVLALLMCTSMLAFVSSAEAPADAVAYGFTFGTLDEYTFKNKNWYDWLEAEVQPTNLNVGDEAIILLNITQNPGFSGTAIVVSATEGAFEFSDPTPDTGMCGVEMVTDNFKTEVNYETAAAKLALANSEDVTATGILLPFKVKVLTEEAMQATFTVKLRNNDPAQQTKVGNIPVPLYSEDFTIALNGWTDTPACDHANTTTSYTNNGDDHTVTVTCDDCTEVISTETLPHDFDELVDSAESTCFEAGYDTYECVCDATKTVERELADHSVKIEYKPATTTEEGYIKEYCVVDGCGEIIRDEVIEIKTETLGGNAADEFVADAEGVKIVAGINKTIVKRAGFIVVGKAALANVDDLAAAEADADQYVVIDVENAYAVVNNKTAEDAFGTGYAMAVKLVGFPAAASGKTVYVTSFVVNMDNSVEYANVGNFVIA